MNTKHKTPQPYFNRDTNTLFLNTIKTPNNLVSKVIPQLEEAKKINIYITSITKLEAEILKIYLTNKKTMQDTDIDMIEKGLLHINLNNVIAYGDGNDEGGYAFASIYQVKHPTKYSHRQNPVYRSYEQTYEYWDGNPYVNMCPDKGMCYQSILRKLGAKGIHGYDNDKTPFYTVIWADLARNPKKFHNL